MKLRLLVLGVASLFAGSAHAATIYLQNFSTGSGMTALSAVNWNAYYGNASTNATLATGGSTGSPANAQLSGGPSGPTTTQNINALSGNGTTITNGFGLFLAASGTQNLIAVSNEYTIDRSVNTPTSFSWYAGSMYTGDLQRLVIQIDGQWYASTSPISPPGTVANGMQFATAAQQFTTTFSTNASDWETVNFAVGSPLTLGSVLSSPLPADNITGFGIYAQIADSNSPATNQKSYFDTFSVNATSVPEPGSAVAFLVATPLLLLIRRRVHR